jgi:hypothetical protein
MAVATQCQTPGAQFHFHVNDDGLSVAVDFGRKISLTGKAAAELEADVHNALELLLNGYYREAAK